MDDTPDMSPVAPPDGIGPHEGRELELMLAGRKPAAMLSDTIPTSCPIPDLAFAPYVKSGAIVRREEIYRKPGDFYALRMVYFALPAEAWRLDALHAIHRATFNGLRLCTDADEIEIGPLLGYSEEEIQAYLDWTEKSRRNRYLSNGNGEA